MIQTLEYQAHLGLVCSFQAELVIVPSLTCSIQMKWNQCHCENSWETVVDEPPNMKERENTSLHNSLSIHFQWTFNGLKQKKLCKTLTNHCFSVPHSCGLRTPYESNVAKTYGRYTHRKHYKKNWLESELQKYKQDFSCLVIRFACMKSHLERS